MCRFGDLSRIKIAVHKIALANVVNYVSVSRKLGKQLIGVSCAEHCLQSHE